MASAPKLRPEDVNRVGEAVLTLARELWVMKDRQLVLERVLDERGIDVSEAVDLYQPDAETQAEMDKMRQKYVDGLLRALSGGG